LSAGLPPPPAVFAHNSLQALAAAVAVDSEAARSQLQARQAADAARQQGRRYQGGAGLDGGGGSSQAESFMDR
jgi:hypothetical protein